MNFYDDTKNMKGYYARNAFFDADPGQTMPKSQLPKLQTAMSGQKCNRSLGSDGIFEAIDIGDSLKELIRTVDSTLDDTAIMVMVVAGAILVGFMSTK